MATYASPSRPTIAHSSHKEQETTNLTVGEPNNISSDKSNRIVPSNKIWRPKLPSKTSDQTSARISLTAKRSSSSNMDCAFTNPSYRYLHVTTSLNGIHTNTKPRSTATFNGVNAHLKLNLKSWLSSQNFGMYSAKKASARTSEGSRAESILGTLHRFVANPFKTVLMRPSSWTSCSCRSTKMI